MTLTKEQQVISTSSSEDEGRLEVSDDTRDTTVAHNSFSLQVGQIRSCPFFKELAVGCFVRIGIGGNEGEPVYRIAEIAGVVETAKVYQLEKTRTNKGLKLKYGKDERMYRIEFVSNSSFTNKEFSHWCSTLKKQNIKMPTISCIDRKEDAIKRADNYRYTNAEIDELVKEKSRFSNDTPNFAHLKRQLLLLKVFTQPSVISNSLNISNSRRSLKQRSISASSGIPEKIDDLDRRAEQLPIRVVSAVPISGVKRPQSSATKQRPIRDEPELAGSDADYAPFIRKSNRMRMVCVPPKSKDILISSPATQKATGIRKRRPAFPDLFSEHEKIDFDIQLNVPEETSSRVPDIEVEFNKKRLIMVHNIWKLDLYEKKPSSDPGRQSDVVI
uniref:Plus3 domain-containing protein n=1 Tax=Ditylenchus dipsaci TaxID=166011 RepID=A0A915DNP2_9BILA